MTADFPIASVIGIAVSDQSHFHEIQQPNLRNTGGGIQRNLPLAIVQEGTVRNFDEQEHMFRFRVRPRIKIRAWPKERNVRLRLAELVQCDGIVDGDDAAPPRR
jgi:hypothetical protein